MSSATNPAFAKDAWQNPRNARTLRAYMALQNQEIGERIRQLRGRRPQTVVADALGVGERTYQTWEHGDAKPSYRSLQKLAEFFGVSEGYILEGLNDGNSGGTPNPFKVSDQLDEIVGEFRARVDDVEGRLGEMEQMLRQRVRHDERVEQLLKEQSEILEAIQALVGFDPSTTLQDRLVQMIRDAAAQAGPGPERTTRSETP